MRHRHYSPRAKVVLSAECGVRSAEFGAERAAYIGLGEPETRLLSLLTLTKVCSSVEEYAHEVFEFFRECDRSGIATVYCESVDEAGIGAALMDRLRRAAQG